MSSSNPKWDTPITMTLKEYFATPFLIPHEGFVKLVRELEKEIGREKTHKIVAKVRDDCARDFAAKLGGGKSFDSFEDFLDNFIPALNSQIGIADASEGYIEESSDCVLKTIYTSCIYPDIYKEWDAQDIGYIWSCMGDYALVNAFCERAGFERPKCLMKGDENCTYCWKWEEDRDA
jgi:hypothetical protein